MFLDSMVYFICSEVYLLRRGVWISFPICDIPLSLVCFDTNKVSLFLLLISMIGVLVKLSLAQVFI